jgi:hypothetical protein
MRYYSIYNKTLDEIYYAEDKETAIAFINDKSRKHSRFIVSKVPVKLVNGHTLNSIAEKTVAYSTESSRVLTADEYSIVISIDKYVSKLGEQMDNAFKLLYLLRDNDFIMDTLLEVMHFMYQLSNMNLYETFFEFGEDMSVYFNVDILTSCIIENNSGRKN